ncbi:AMP-binding protein [Nocardia miyunensis]|uniref:AMP-binding protein n=1 Tax=Nocardia miyunensis TaxID=282684 RepID=UPI000836CA5E|nr:AMP-binding protein [Nocardia miyunensis]
MSSAGHQHVVGELLRHRASAYPDRPYCYVAGKGYTFAELDRRSDEVAAGFAAHGVGKGDRVALLMPNRIEFIEAYFGLAKLGAIQVPLNAFLKGDFLRHQLADSRASVVILDNAGYAAVEPLLEHLPELRLLVPLDPPPSDRPASTVEVLAFDDVVASGGGTPPQVQVSLDDPMSILYTSGTTGFPKGCVLPHGYYARVGRVAIHGLELTEDDSLFAPLPMFHLSGGIFMLISALIMGIPVHYAPQFSAKTFMSDAVAAEATVVLGVGAMSLALLSTPPGPADRAHRIRAMMVAPLGPADQERFRERFGIDPWTEVYGQTECMPVTVTPISAPRDPAGCGVAAPDLEVALLLDDLTVAPDGEVGEICLRPREKFAIFDGYWDNSAATLKSFQGLWYHTGDFARRLPSGQIAFVDRKSDALRRKGENVSSLELENAIRRISAVADVAVHGVPAETTEDEIKACIVLKPDMSITPVELFEFFRTELPYFAIPRYIEILESLPVNAMNRVMKHQLRARPNGDDVWDFTKLGLAVAAADRR